jgi:hypothetical protein
MPTAIAFHYPVRPTEVAVSHPSAIRANSALILCALRVG